MGMGIAAGFVERDGRHLYDSVAFFPPDGAVHVYRKRNLVFWERFRFRPGRDPLVVATPWGRIGFAICADMIYRDVWDGYRGRIDLAVVSSAWPDFADRETGRKHWLLGQVGPLSRAIPGRVAHDLGIPVVFANQCGPTRDGHPGPGPPDRRPIRGREQRLRRPARPPGPGGGRRTDGALPGHGPTAERSPFMAFYVPLGPRGILMRLGSLVLVVAGGLVYWRASRRRPGSAVPVDRRSPAHRRPDFGSGRFRYSQGLRSERPGGR